jgi:thiol-disulfide isomerase/thioredoxin
MMDKVKKNLVNLLSYKMFLLILFITVIFLIASIYTYKRYVSPKINKAYVANKEFINDPNTEKVADIYFFYTTWCPHCKKAMPIWKSFKDEIGENKVKGYRINFLEVDCDKDQELAEKFNISGYPTIKLVNGNQTVEYDAKPDKDTLMQFLNSSL